MKVLMVQKPPGGLHVGAGGVVEVEVEEVVDVVDVGGSLVDVGGYRVSR